VVLDWGLAGHLTRRLRYALADFWRAAVDQDAERIVQIAMSLAPTDARPDQRVMEKDVTLALREELNFAIGRQQLGRAMLKLLFIFGRHGISLSRDYSLMAKAVLAIEEIGRTLDPQFDLRAHTAPVLREMYRERSSPRTLVRHARDFLGASFRTLQDLPDELHRLVRRLEHDNLTINFQHRGLDELDEGLRTAANRIALGVVIGSLIIGSDQVLALDGELLGKPHSRRGAREQLLSLQGLTHQLITAVAVLDTTDGRLQDGVDIHTLHMRTLTKEQIATYVEIDEPIDCAGSYRLESLGIALFARIEGADDSAVVGLPLLTLLTILEQFGVDPLSPPLTNAQNAGLI